MGERQFLIIGMTKAASNQFYICIGLIVVLLTNLFLFVPFDIYLANNDEFITPFSEVMYLIAIPAITVLAIFAIIAMILKDNMLQRFTILITVMSILVWVQSDILIWEYGLLDGESIDWSEKKWRGWVDISVWLSAIFLSWRYYKNFYKNIMQFAIAIFLIQLVMTFSSAVRNSDRLDNRRSSNTEVLQQYFKFSSQHNIVHILLDGYQSDIFEDLVQHEKLGESIRSSLDGFVFYKENLGIFPYTRFALPALLSGKIYENNLAKDDFIKLVLTGETILNLAYQSGYQVDIASEEYWAERYVFGQHNISLVIPKFGLGSAADFQWVNSSKILDLTLFKSAPHFLKESIYNKQKWLIQPLFSNPLSSFNYFSHTKFMQEITKNMELDRETPVYKYMHIMNVHNPMVVTPDCRFAGGAIATTRESLTAQSLCTLATVIDLLEKMKSLGIYDDALIILHADHGGWVKTKGFKEQKLANGADLNPAIMSLATPLLAIKQPGVKGELQVSAALVSLTDIPDTISDIMNWGKDFGHQSVLDVVPGQPRSRSYYYYAWQRDAWEAEHTGTIQEFTFEGSHFGTDWNFGKVFNPPQVSNK